MLRDVKGMALYMLQRFLARFGAASVAFITISFIAAMMFTNPLCVFAPARPGLDATPGMCWSCHLGDTCITLFKP